MPRDPERPERVRASPALSESRRTPRSTSRLSPVCSRSLRCRCLRRARLSSASHRAACGAACARRESGPDEPPPRALIFAADEAAAVAAAQPLRSNLWGAHTLSVLLPTGNEPIRALHAFRDNAATLMLCTPAAERGLDLPSVRHVYSMGSITDPTAYLHRSGRAGRIGAVEKAMITTLCEEQEARALPWRAGNMTPRWSVEWFALP